MKINVKFNELHTCVEQMGAKKIKIDVDIDFESIDFNLLEGIEIDPTDVESTDILLSYKGRQILLYIPDQGKSINKVINNPENGRRFHIANCETLIKMKRENRFERYIVTNDTSGIFKVRGYDEITNKEMDASVKLKVCKNCLKILNYNGYTSANNSEKNEIFKKFNLNEFFEEYSTLFKELPKHQNKIYETTYTDNWDEISRNYKASKNYICESCHTSFKEHKKLLVIHHINGIKSDNSTSNLKALCLDCHRKEPKHNHLLLSFKDMKTIYKLRRSQGKMLLKSWEDIFRLSDKALHGFLKAMQTRGRPIPEIGYIINLPNGKEVLLDIAWPKEKKAVARSNENIDIPGWRIWKLEKALNIILGQ